MRIVLDDRQVEWVERNAARRNEHARKNNLKSYCGNDTDFTKPKHEMGLAGELAVCVAYGTTLNGVLMHENKVLGAPDCGSFIEVKTSFCPEKVPMSKRSVYVPLRHLLRMEEIGLSFAFVQCYTTDWRRGLDIAGWQWGSEILKSVPTTQPNGYPVKVYPAKDLKSPRALSLYIKDHDLRVTSPGKL